MLHHLQIWLRCFLFFLFFPPKYRVSVYLCSFILALVEEGKECWGYLSISVGIWTWICPGILTLKPRLYPILAIWLAPDCAWERKIGTELWHVLQWWPGRRACACLVKTELKWLFKLYFFDISSPLLPLHSWEQGLQCKYRSNSSGGSHVCLFALQTWSVDMSPWWHVEQEDWATFLQLENIPLQYRYCNNLLNFLDRGKKEDGKMEQSVHFWDCGLKNTSTCCCCQEQNLACDVGGSLS